MKRYFLILIILFCFCGGLLAQSNVKNFGKVSNDDFSETVFDDLGYDAVVLQNFRKIYFYPYNGNLRFYNEYHVRIKVLKDNLFEGKSFEIPYSGRYEYEKLLMPKGVVYSQNSGKIVSKKMKFKDFKYVDSDSLKSKVVVKLPEVKKGDVFEFRYYLATYDFMLPEKFEFSTEYPCLKSVFVGEFPEHLSYKFDVYDPQEVVSRSTNYSFVSFGCSYYRNNLNFRFHAIVDTFYVNNILPKGEYSDLETSPKVVAKAFKFTQGINEISPIYQAAWFNMTHFLYVYSEPENRYLSQFEAMAKFYPSGYYIVRSDSWEILHKSLRKSPYFLKPVMKSFELNNDLKKIISLEPYEDTLKMIENIFNYVNQNISWDGTFKNHLDQKPENVLRTLKGNSAEINLTLVSLLRRAGIEAFPALAATKDYMKIDTSYANSIQFNHVLAVAKISDKLLVMDCCDKNQPFDQLPQRDLNNCCWAVEPERGYFIWF